MPPANFASVVFLGSVNVSSLLWLSLGGRDRANSHSVPPLTLSPVLTYNSSSVQETPMTPRSHRSPEERDARSRAVQLLADKPLLRGSLVLQHRSCGKSYCRCRTRPEASGSLSPYPLGRPAGSHLHPAGPPRHGPRRGSTTAARSISWSIASRNTTSRPSWSRNRRSSPARAAPNRRTLRRDGTVLCLCREGLRAGPAIPHPDRLADPSPHPDRRGLRQRLHSLRHPPRQPQRPGAGPAHPRAVAGHRRAPSSPASTPSAASMP